MYTAESLIKCEKEDRKMPTKIEFREILKFNKNHGKGGRFVSGPNSASGLKAASTLKPRAGEADVHDVIHQKTSADGKKVDTNLGVIFPFDHKESGTKRYMTGAFGDRDTQNTDKHFATVEEAHHEVARRVAYHLKRTGMKVSDW